MKFTGPLTHGRLITCGGFFGCSKRAERVLNAVYGYPRYPFLANSENATIA
jgi:hypothetical protein